VTQHPDDGVLHALLDGEIRAAELPAIEAHLRSCATCVARLEEARSFRDEAERLVGEIELPAPELPIQATGVAARPLPPRRVHLRPLAYAATLLAALGLGYGARGWLGSSGGGATTTAADLAAAPVAPSESSLADMVSRFSRLAVDVPGLRELELNPVVVDEEGSTAVDARGMVA